MRFRENTLNIDDGEEKNEGKNKILFLLMRFIDACGETKKTEVTSVKTEGTFFILL